MLPVLQWCYIPVFLFLLNQIFFFKKKDNTNLLYCSSTGQMSSMRLTGLMSRCQQVSILFQRIQGRSLFCTYLLIDCWQNAVSCGHGLKLTPLPSWLSAECIPSFQKLPTNPFYLQGQQFFQHLNFIWELVMINFYVLFLIQSVLLGPSEMGSRVACVQELLNKQIHGKTTMGSVLQISQLCAKHFMSPVASQLSCLQKEGVELDDL